VAVSEGADWTYRAPWRVYRAVAKALAKVGL